MSLPLVAQGEFDLVKEHLEACVSKPALMRGFLITDSVLNFVLADVAMMQRNEADLRLYAPLAAKTAERDSHMLFQASAERALGVMHRLSGEYEQSEAHLQDALQRFEKLETSWQIGRSLAEMAELEAARSNCARAKELYAQAIDAFDKMAAKPDMKRVWAALEALD